MTKIEIKKQICADWFKDLRGAICQEFVKIEQEYLNSERGGPLKYNKLPNFERKTWKRDVDDGCDGGGGEMSKMKGNVFEKVGVNISSVYGQFDEKFRSQMPETKDSSDFFATGISLVAHMASPLAPAIHMNTRFIVTGKDWFGGGTDLNPIYEDEKDTADFHASLKKACDKYEDGAHEKYKKECDEYFFIKHRNCSRGVGGIFYDNLNSGDFDKDLQFTKDVGLAFLDIFPKLVRRSMFKEFTEEQREHQLRKRGLYTEFNLVYDRGTKFGLMTGGNVDAILMSLPPIAKWS